LVFFQWGHNKICSPEAAEGEGEHNELCDLLNLFLGGKNKEADQKPMIGVVCLTDVRRRS